VQKLALTVHVTHLAEEGLAGYGPGPPGKPAGVGMLESQAAFHEPPEH